MVIIVTIVMRTGGKVKHNWGLAYFPPLLCLLTSVSTQSHVSTGPVGAVCPFIGVAVGGIVCLLGVVFNSLSFNEKRDTYFNYF